MNDASTQFEEMERLHPNARWFKRFANVLGATALVGVPALAGLILASARFDVELGRWLPWLPLAAIAIGLPLGWWIADRRFERTRFRLDATGLEIHQGLFWRRQTRVARTRIQHTDVNRGPLDRRVGLAALKVFTAGTRLSSIELDGLPAERALQLRDALLDGGRDGL